MDSLFFSLIQVALGKRDTLAREPSASEWKELFEMSQRQAVTGIGYAAIARLMPQGRPFSSIIERPAGIMNLSAELYYEWMGAALKIQQRNEKMNSLCLKLQNKMNEAGLNPVTLKGQGVAQLYVSEDPYMELPSFRQSGDIDVWLKGGRATVLKQISALGKVREVRFLHASLKIFKHTEVEVHFMPTCLNSPKHDKRLQEWFDTFDFSKFRENSLGITVPSGAFNEVYILLHIFRHLLGEGIGLRQMMDYYFVLMSRDKSGDGETTTLSESFGIGKFAAAVMWILGEVFGMQEEDMLWEPDEEVGRKVLHEIMLAGNFGHGDQRKKDNETRLQRFIRVNMTNMKFLPHFPSEVLFTPFMRAVRAIKGLVGR